MDPTLGREHLALKVSPVTKQDNLAANDADDAEVEPEPEDSIPQQCKLFRVAKPLSQKSTLEDSLWSSETCSCADDEDGADEAEPGVQSSCGAEEACGVKVETESASLGNAGMCSSLETADSIMSSLAKEAQPNYLEDVDCANYSFREGSDSSVSSSSSSTAASSSSSSCSSSCSSSPSSSLSSQPSFSSSSSPAPSYRSSLPSASPPGDSTSDSDSSIEEVELDEDAEAEQPVKERDHGFPALFPYLPQGWPLLTIREEDQDEIMEEQSSCDEADEVQMSQDLKALAVAVKALANSPGQGAREILREPVVSTESHEPKEVERAALRLQTFERGRRTRSEFFRVRSAIVTLQAWMRGKHQRVIFQQNVKAALRLQRCFRKHLIAKIIINEFIAADEAPGLFADDSLPVALDNDILDLNLEFGSEVLSAVAHWVSSQKAATLRFEALQEASMTKPCAKSESEDAFLLRGASSLVESSIEFRNRLIHTNFFSVLHPTSERTEPSTDHCPSSWWQSLLCSGAKCGVICSDPEQDVTEFKFRTPSWDLSPTDERPSVR